MDKAIFGLMLALLAGCTTTPRYDQHFGDAVRRARAAMAINQGAPAGADPAAGIDGPAAREALTRYQDSFKTPPPVLNPVAGGGVNR